VDCSFGKGHVGVLFDVDRPFKLLLLEMFIVKLEKSSNASADRNVALVDVNED
jgi:hypothetical protein